MSSDLRIVRVRDFMQFTPHGVVDLPRTVAKIREVAAAPGAFSDYDVLADMRGAEPHLSVADAWTVAEQLAKAVHSGPHKGFLAKISILCPAEHFDLAQFVALSARNRGLNVRAFTAFEEVFEWLAVSRPSTKGQSP
jgi:hypothetical protein